MGMPHPQCRLRMDGVGGQKQCELVERCGVTPWPGKACYLEFSTGMFIYIESVEQLKFCCEMVTRFHARHSMREPKSSTARAGAASDLLSVDVQSGIQQTASDELC
eukprot:2296562-Rhodomonas_salina.2